jgi:hypothetical protein
MAENWYHPTKPIKIQRSIVQGAKKDGSLKIVQDFRQMLQR